MIVLDAALSQLESAQLIRRADVMEFMFKHALTQDAAYLSLLQKQRRAIHAAVISVYEELYADRTDEFAPLLAQHAAEAGDDAKALHYATCAGDAAARVYANAEAIEHYTQAIQLAERVEDLHKACATLRDLYLKRGRVYELSDQFAQALANYDAMAEFARAHNDRAMELASLIAEITIYSIPSKYFDIERAKTLIAGALALAREIGDQASEVKILWNMVLFNSRLDTNYREAIGYGEQAIAIARALNLREQLAYLLNDVSMIYVWLGNPEQGTATNLEAREMFRALNNLPMLTDNLGYAIMRHITLGEYMQAIAVSHEALEISRRIGNDWGETFALSWVGEAYRELGDIDQAIAAMENSVRLAEHSFQAPLAFTRSDLGVLYGDLGQPARGLPLVQLARQIGERIANVMNVYTAAQIAHLQIMTGALNEAQATVEQALAHRGNGMDDSMFGMAIHAAHCELWLAQGDYAQTIRVCDDLINRLHAYRLHQYLANALWLKGLALSRQGKIAEAFACLQTARIEAERMQSRWMLWRILAALADVEPDAAQARQWRTQARANLEYIAAHTPPAFRASFLNLPAVQKVMTK